MSVSDEGRVTTPAPRRLRLRLVLLVVLLGAWFLRWTTAQTAIGASLHWSISKSKYGLGYLNNLGSTMWSVANLVWGRH